MTDDTALPQSTVTSNNQAARLACRTERERVLRILATAEASIPPPVMAAISEGTPAAIYATKQRLQAAAAAKDGSDRPGASGGASSWGKITSRVNAKRRSTVGSADPEAAAS